MSRPGAKVAMGILGVLSAPGILLAGSNVYNQFWSQWAGNGAWSSWGTGLAHSAMFPLVILIAASSFALAPIVGGWWLWNRKTAAFPHGIVAAWLALLVASALSWLPSSQQYAAVAVFLFGPGDKSQELQQRAASADSTLLLDALIFRGARIDEKLMCVAAQNRDDSPRVVSYLVQRGVSANVDCGYAQVYKSTPLHNAVTGGKYRVAAALLKAGAKTDERDYQGRTPLDIAVTRGDEHMIRLFKQ